MITIKIDPMPDDYESSRNDLEILLLNYLKHTFTLNDAFFKSNAHLNALKVTLNHTYDFKSLKLEDDPFQTALTIYLSEILNENC